MKINRKQLPLICWWISREVKMNASGKMTPLISKAKRLRLKTTLRHIYILYYFLHVIRKQKKKQLTKKIMIDLWAQLEK